MFLCGSFKGESTSSVFRCSLFWSHGDLMATDCDKLYFSEHSVSHWSTDTKACGLWDIKPPPVWLELLSRSFLLLQGMSSSTLMTSVCSARLTPMLWSSSSPYRLVRVLRLCFVEDIRCPSTPRTRTLQRAPPSRPSDWSTAHWWWTGAAATTPTWSICRWAPSFPLRLWRRPEPLTPGTRIWMARRCRPPRPVRRPHTRRAMIMSLWPRLGRLVLPGQRDKDQSCWRWRWWKVQKVSGSQSQTVRPGSELNRWCVPSPSFIPLIILIIQILLDSFLT